MCFQVLTWKRLFWNDAKMLIWMEIIVVLNSKTTHVHVNMACNLNQKKGKD